MITTLGAAEPNQPPVNECIHHACQVTFLKALDNRYRRPYRVRISLTTKGFPSALQLPRLPDRCVAIRYPTWHSTQKHSPPYRIRAVHMTAAGLSVERLV